MAKQNNCENCYREKREFIPATWRVKDSLDELCDACRATLGHAITDCLPLNSERSKEPASPIKPRYCECDPDCKQPVYGNRTYAWGHKQKAARASVKPGKRATPQKPIALPLKLGADRELPTSQDGFQVEILSESAYNERFFAMRFVSPAMITLLTKIDGLPPGQVLVIATKGEQEMSALRERLHRTLLRHRGKKYKARVCQVRKHGHVTVQKRG